MISFTWEFLNDYFGYRPHKFYDDLLVPIKINDRYFTHIATGIGRYIWYFD